MAFFPQFIFSSTVITTLFLSRSLSPVPPDSSSCLFFSMNLTVFGIFCSSYRWEFIQSSFFLPVSLHVIILLLFSFFVAIYGNTNLKMNFLIVFFASYREFLLSFSPPPSHSLFLYFFFFFSFLFLIH